MSYPPVKGPCRGCGETQGEITRRAGLYRVVCRACKLETETPRSTMLVALWDWEDNFLTSPPKETA